MLSYSFRTSVSFLALSLSLLSTPLMAMDTEGLPSLSAAARKLTLTGEASWQEIKRVMGIQLVAENPVPQAEDTRPFDIGAFYSRKYSFSDPKPDPKPISRFLLDKNRAKEGYAQVVSLLASEVENGNEDMAQQLHGLLRLNTFTSPDSPRLAAFLLEACLEQYQMWAYKESVKSEGRKPEADRRDLDVYHHYFAAAYSDMEAALCLDKKYDYNNQVVDKFLKKLQSSSAEKQESLVSGYIKKWGHYYRPLLDLAGTNHFAIEKHQLRLFELAAKLNSRLAMSFAGCFLQTGFEGQAPDTRRALEWHLKTAALGNKEAMVTAGSLLEWGFEGQVPDLTRALDLYLQAAELGDIPAMVNAGALQYAPNPKRAFDLFFKAAELEDRRGMVITGSLLQDGFEGQSPNPKSALEWYLKAAELGVDEGMFNAAFLFQNGFEGQAPNPGRALGYYLKAAKLGYALAMNNAALLLETGFEGQAPDPRLALEWYLKAAELGACEAMANAAILLEKGFEGQAPDLIRALGYTRQAAAKDYTPAMIAITLHCVQYSDQEHLQEAYSWAKKADALGDPEAKELLESFIVSSTDVTFHQSESEEESQEDIKLSKIINDLKNPQPVQRKASRIDLSAAVIPSESLSSSESAEEESDELASSAMQPSESAAAPMETELPAQSVEERESATVPITNIKTLRARLKEAGRLGQIAEEKMTQARAKLQTPPAKKVLTLLLDFTESYKVTQDNLKTLFADPLFVGQVEVIEKAHGIGIQTTHPRTQEPLSTSAHFKHKKKRNNFDPAFLSFIRKNILPAFGLGQE